MRLARGCARLLLALGLLARSPGFGAALAQDDTQLALAVKAAFLEKFQLYVTWPDRAFASPTSPFNLCVAGAEPFGALLDRAASGQSAGRHRIAVLYRAAATPADHCHIVYIAMRDGAAIRQQLAALAGLPVLTVTDQVAEDSEKGIIDFVITHDRVRFEIDTVQAARGGLSISSKLLGVATAVRSAS